MAKPTYASGGWAVGLTTHPSRRSDLLPKTLASLRGAGFDSIRLFVDDCPPTVAGEYATEFGCHVTSRWPCVRAYANWALALGELYLRQPSASLYAIFQDDCIAVPNLRAYLDQCGYPDGTDPRFGGRRGYLNCYLWKSNYKIVPRKDGKEHVGWYPSNQLGKGAVGLVFNRDAVVALLNSRHMADRVLSVVRGHKSIDGGVVDSLRAAGFDEFVHNPSLLYHTGTQTTLDHRFGPAPPTPAWQPDFDPLALVG